MSHVWRILTIPLTRVDSADKARFDEDLHHALQDEELYQRLLETAPVVDKSILNAMLTRCEP